MNFTKFEKARIIGSRALQIAMGAPFLIKLSNDDLERILKAMHRWPLWGNPAQKKEAVAIALLHLYCEVHGLCAKV